MKKNVLIFIPSIEDGGVEKNLFEVSNYLNNNKISLEILTCNNNMSGKFSKDIAFIGTKKIFWQNKNRPIKYFVDRKSTRLNSSHSERSRMPSSA